MPAVKPLKRRLQSIRQMPFVVETDGHNLCSRRYWFESWTTGMKQQIIKKVWWKPFHGVENHTGKHWFGHTPVWFVTARTRYIWALDHRRWQDWMMEELWWRLTGLSLQTKEWQNTTLSKMTALSPKISTSSRVVCQNIKTINRYPERKRIKNWRIEKRQRRSVTSIIAHIDHENQL